jgi:rhamnogalacturonyl hydrolase YesR
MNICLSSRPRGQLYSPGRPQTKWTYSQGVIASGLGVLYVATGDRTYLTEAEKTLDAVVAGMTSGRILKEVCDDAIHSTCNEDQVGSVIPTN